MSDDARPFDPPAVDPTADAPAAADEPAPGVPPAAADEPAVAASEAQAAPEALLAGHQPESLGAPPQPESLTAAPAPDAIAAAPTSDAITAGPTHAALGAAAAGAGDTWVASASEPTAAAPTPETDPWLASGATATDAASEPVTAPAGAAVPPSWPPAGAAPMTAAAPAKRPGRGRQFLAGALVGALVGGAVGGGVAALATRDDTKKTTIVTNATPVSTDTRNTSRLATPQDVQGVISRVEPAVVAIRTGDAVDDGLFSGGGSSNGDGGAGTGFVITSDGVVVTNNHVVEGANGRIEVTFNDGTNKTAKVLGRTPELDLAVLKVKDVSGLPVAQLGTSSDLVVGDEVIAIGNALALEGGLSVTRGIISAKGRSVQTNAGTTLFNMLQTDAAINPGNSGGPLVNSDGQVIGINTAIANPSNAQNVGFAIAIDSARPIIEQLRDGKQVRLAFLGVQTQSVTPAVANELNLRTTQTGAVIVRITKDSAASQAGLAKDDVIVSIDGQEVRRADDVGAIVRRMSPGDKVTVVVERDGARRSIDVTLGSVPLSDLG